MMHEKDNLTGDEAKDALDSIKTMESAGYRLAVPRRWFGVGICTVCHCDDSAVFRLNLYSAGIRPFLGTDRSRIDGRAGCVVDK